MIEVGKVVRNVKYGIEKTAYVHAVKGDTVVLKRYKEAVDSYTVSTSKFRKLFPGN